MYNDNSSPTLINVTFVGNSAYEGGGMANNGSNPTLSNVTFIGNNAAGYGGGMYNEISNPALSNVTFIGNAAGYGGGMHNFLSSPTILNVVFSGNNAERGGGMLNSNSSPALANVTFSGNTATWGGGMANFYSSPTLANVTISSNTANTGGGIYNDNNSNPTLSNAILWGNTPGQIDNLDSTPVVSYSNIQGGYPGTGNINADPLFMRSPSPGADGTWGTTDDDYGDLRLQLTSPAIDAGDNAAVPAGLLTDLLGYPRFVDIPSVPDTGSGAPPIVDMGAYEAHIQLADQLFVDQNAPGPLHDGTSWANAFFDLQAALEAAMIGDEIWVADGTYKPTLGSDRTATFALKSGVAIYGGFAGTETSRGERNWLSNVTILSGDIGVEGDNSDNSYHVVTGTQAQSSAILDGFTITAGNANGASPHDRGGGMHNWLEGPTLANLIFSGNQASGCGAGMTNWQSDPTLTDVAFYNNSSSGCGGGMYNVSSWPVLIGVTFSNNTATTEGGGIYNLNSAPVITSTVILSNTAGLSGGGIYCSGGDMWMTNVTFSGNDAMHGGGMFNNDCYPRLINITFTANHAAYGGAVENFRCSNLELTNVVFSGNDAGEGGGMVNTQSNPVLTNVTFSANTADELSGWMTNYESSTPRLINTVVWGNNPLQTYNSSTPLISYSDIQGGCPAGATCDHLINADPLFLRSPSPGGDGSWGTADDDYGDLRLQLTSPAIDAGDNSAVPAGVLTDLLGYPRFIDIASVPNTGSGTPPIVDMGAYEVQLIVYLPVLQK